MKVMMLCHLLACSPAPAPPPPPPPQLPLPPACPPLLPLGGGFSPSCLKAKARAWGTARHSTQDTTVRSSASRYRQCLHSSTWTEQAIAAALLLQLLPLGGVFSTSCLKAKARACGTAQHSIAQKNAVRSSVGLNAKKGLHLGCSGSAAADKGFFLVAAKLSRSHTGCVLHDRVLHMCNAWFHGPAAAAAAAIACCCFCCCQPAHLVKGKGNQLLG